MKRSYTGLVLALLLGAPAIAAADDLTGEQVILCTAVHATLCTDYGNCDSLPPWDLNIPQFIEVNLKDKTLSTTKASAENRATPIKNLQREDGQIFLQGVETGRAFSFVIDEKTGMASIAVARQGKTVSVFGACTPMPAPAAK
ncbi:MAG: hypothetical protein ACM3SU_05135 [Acidobacteriota bacterium]